MERKEIIAALKKYFKIAELVSRKVLKRFGEVKSWGFLDTNLLNCLLILRENLNKGITINNSQFQQRGFRENTCKIVRNKTLKNKMYCSAHTFGKAIDFDVQGMTADEVRRWIVSNEKLFPCKIRLENKIVKTGKTINWVHLDIMDYEQKKKIYLFNI